jgi:hypothetical protein
LRTRSLAATALTALLLAGCGDDGAVSSKASLDELGAKVADPATRTMQLIGGSSANGDQKVADDATKDRSCSGGHRRVFKATVTADLSSGDDETAVRNRVSLTAQASLKDAGVKVTTDLGKDASTVPASLDFTNEPSDKAQKRTFHTVVKVGSDSYTWSITGKTACIAN